ncbi:MAG: response regulator [Magnetococcales bacterium]|nr:response regulator [Magnetococcales bacterium]
MADSNTQSVINKENKAKILIVDDIPGNILVLAEILDENYDVAVATSGKQALEITAKEQPDLILLDIVMPEMDGYEVCTRIKQDSVSKDIPIIFITAKNAPWDESKGLGLGAVDFLTKPIRPQIVKARVKTHIELKKQKDGLKDSAKKLEKQVLDRTMELQDTINLLSNEVEDRKLAEQTAVRNARLASLGTLAAGVAHEINNPNNAIGFAAATLTRLWQEFIPHLNEYKQANKDIDICSISIEEAIETISTLVLEVGNNSKRIAAIVTNLKQMTKGDTENLEQKVDINKALQSAVAILDNVIKKHTNHLTMELYKDLQPIRGNIHQLEQVFINVIQNALESLPNKDKKVIISTKKGHGKNHNSAIVVVQDEGIGINSNYLDMITRPFYTTKGDDGGTGLGLSISKTILNNHHGTIQFKSQPKKGTNAIIKLPIEKYIQDQAQ